MLPFIPTASANNIDALRASADIIEEVSANLIYFGFCAPGDHGTDAERKAKPIWSVMRIDISGSSYPITTTYTWAGGVCAFTRVWNDRAALDYQIKKF